MYDLIVIGAGPGGYEAAAYAAKMGKKVALFEKQELGGFLAREGLTPAAILLTHGHPDHICYVREMQALYSIPAYLSPADKAMLPLFQLFGKIIKMEPDIAFTPTDATDGMEIRIGDNLCFKVIATPGHTPGGTCYYEEKGAILLSGDTLFAGSVGRTDFKGSDYNALVRSIRERLLPLPGSDSSRFPATRSSSRGTVPPPPSPPSGPPTPTSCDI